MPVFRWIPEEEAWLEARIIADGGQSDTNNKQWLRSLVADFQNTFPFVARRTPSGMTETQKELAARWKDIPRRVKRWIQNHQDTVLSKHSHSQPQTSAMRSSTARLKRPRSKNARDMAKANHSQLKTLWTELRARVKDGELTKSQMLVEHNNAVTKLLQDEHWNAYYFEMANRPDADGPPLVERVTDEEPNHSTTRTLQFISCEPQASESTEPENHHIPLDESSDAPSISYSFVDDSNYRSIGPTFTPSILEPAFPSSFTDPDMATVPEIASAHGLSSADTELEFNPPVFAPTSDTSFGAHAPSNVSMPPAHIHQNSYHIPAHVEPSPPHSVPPANPSFTSINPHTFASTTQSTLDFNPRLIDDTVDVQSQAGHASAGTVQRHRHPIAPIADTPRSTVTTTHSRTFKDWSSAGDWYLYKTIFAPSSPIYCTAFAPNGKSIVAGSYDGSVTVWNVQTYETILGPLKGHRNFVSAISISPDGRYIVSGSFDHTVRIWNAQTGAKLLRFTGLTYCINDVAFWPDSSRVISSDSSGSILMWDVSSGDTIRSFARPKHPVSHLDCSADGRFILAAYGERVSIWNVASGELVPQSSEELTDFSSVWPDFSKLYTYSDGRVRAWKVDSDNSELGLTPWYRSSISPDREYIAVPRNSGLEGLAIYSRRPQGDERPSLSFVEYGLWRGGRRW